MSLAKVETVAFGIFGLIVAAGLLVFWAAGLLQDVWLIVLILSPPAYAVGGFISGAVSAWLYNLAAAWVGGVHIEFAE